MGLDSFAFSTCRTPAACIDIASHDTDQYLFGWRKHRRLHAWMERLYRHRGGTDAFNIGASVVITASDLDALETAILAGCLARTETTRADAPQASIDLAFLTAARHAIREGRTVYYFGSW